MLDTPDRVDSVVAEQAGAGWTALEVYHSLSPSVYDAFIADARLTRYR